MAPKRTAPGKRSLRRGALVVLAALGCAAAIGFAYAQSGAGYSLNLNSPVSFPVDI